MTFEWTFLTLPCRLVVQDGTLFGLAISSLEIDRNPALKLEFKGRHNGPSKVAQPTSRPGTMAKGVSVPVTLPKDYIDCLLEGARESFRSSEIDYSESFTTVRGRAERLCASFGDSTPCVTTKWFCNLPTRHWPHSTRRKGTPATHERARDHQKWAERDRGSTSSTRDHLGFDLTHPKISRVVVGMVREAETGSDTAILKPGFLELTAGKKGPPDDELRRTVLRGLEFLFGTGLGVVGTSEFTSEGQCIHATLDSAFIPGGAQPACPPALLHNREVDGLDPLLVQLLVQRFLERASDYDLNRAVWLYLNARSAPLDMAAGYIGAAFEILVRGYYEQPANKKRSLLVPDKATWRAIRKTVAQALKGLEGSGLAGAPGTVDEILNRFGNLNAVSGTKLHPLFLNDLKLQHGKVERDALQARNDAAHANRLDPEFNFVLRNYRAIHTLFSRALFGILEVDVKYFDYSSIDFPPRRLAEPQQGTAYPEDDATDSKPSSKGTVPPD